MKNHKIKAGADLNKIMKAIFAEAAESIRQHLAEELPHTGDPEKDLGDKDLLVDEPVAVDDTSSVGNDEEKLESGDVDANDVIEKLNSIRSGRSFRDSGVKSTLEQYIGDLDKAERTALYAFLKGVAQIVTGEVPFQQATQPDASPADVDMQKDSSAVPEQPSSGKSSKVVVKPTIKGGAAPKKKSRGAEDTSSPVPITPKKK